MTLQFIGLIVAGYSSVKMISMLDNKQHPTFVRVFAAINLIATMFFALMILASGAIK